MSVAVPRTRRRQQREETRRQILDTAQELLRQGSFRDLSADAIMARTGHSRTVFYRHFDDVASLVLTLIQEIGAEVVDLGERWAATTTPGPDQARARLGALVDFHVRFGPLVRAVAEASHHDPEVAQAYDGMVEGFIGLTASAIQERAAAGQLAVEHPDQLARALVRMLNAYLQDALGREPRVDPAVVLDVVTLIWTRTLFPDAT